MAMMPPPVLLLLLEASVPVPPFVVGAAGKTKRVCYAARFSEPDFAALDRECEIQLCVAAA